MMKASHLLPLLLITSLSAQDAIPPRAELLAPIIREPIVQPEPKPVLRIEVPEENIIQSETVTKGDQTVIVQKIAPVALPPVPVAPPAPVALTPEQIEARAARHALAPKRRMLMLSCTVYDHRHTLISWTSQGKTPVEFFKAWSNVNFFHLNPLHQFKKNDVIYSLMFGIGHEDTAKAAARYARFGKTYHPPAIPSLPADPFAQPTFLVTEGNPTAEDLAPIIGLHEIYQDHHQTLISEHQRITAQQQREEAERRAAPPLPKPQIIIQHWTTNPSASTAVETKGEPTK